MLGLIKSRWARVMELLHGSSFGDGGGLGVVVEQEAEGVLLWCAEHEAYEEEDRRNNILAEWRRILNDPTSFERRFLWMEAGSWSRPYADSDKGLFCLNFNQLANHWRRDDRFPVLVKDENGDPVLADDGKPISVLCRPWRLARI